MDGTEDGICMQYMHQACRTCVNCVTMDQK